MVFPALVIPDRPQPREHLVGEQRDVLLGQVARLRTATYKELVDSQVAIVGSPATVADQIEAFVREFRIGNLMVMLQNGSMPRDLTEKNISLFAEQVLPRLRPIWDDEGWENHWWPRARQESPAGLGQQESPAGLGQQESRV